MTAIIKSMLHKREEKRRRKEMFEKTQEENRVKYGGLLRQFKHLSSNLSDLMSQIYDVYAKDLDRGNKELGPAYDKLGDIFWNLVHIRKEVEYLIKFGSIFHPDKVREIISNLSKIRGTEKLIPNNYSTWPANRGILDRNRGKETTIGAYTRELTRQAYNLSKDLFIAMG